MSVARRPGSCLASQHALVIFTVYAMCYTHGHAVSAGSLASRASHAHSGRTPPSDSCSQNRCATIGVAADRHGRRTRCTNGCPPAVGVG